MMVATFERIFPQLARNSKRLKGFRFNSFSNMKLARTKTVPTRDSIDIVRSTVNNVRSCSMLREWEGRLEVTGRLVDREILGLRDDDNDVPAIAAAWGAVRGILEGWCMDTTEATQNTAKWSLFLVPADAVSPLSSFSGSQICKMS
jgi:hypothetical protein